MRVIVGGGVGSSCGGSGGSIGVSPDGFVFPLQTTQKLINDGVDGATWPSERLENAHHDYNAADIFAETGTPVLAAKPGTIISAKNVDDSYGSRVTIKGDDGFVYYYTHMGVDTITVSRDSGHVDAGQKLGEVGTNANAQGTTRHLHFDMLPPEYQARPSCSSEACAALPFILVQPVLVEAFSNLAPE